jgi:hypothetical protein
MISQRLSPHNTRRGENREGGKYMVFEGEYALVEKLSKKYGIKERLLLGICDSAEDLESFAANLASGVQGKPNPPVLRKAEQEKKHILEGDHWYATREEVEAMTMDQYKRWADAGHHLAPGQETLEEKVEREQEAEAQDWERQHQIDVEESAEAERKKQDTEAEREAENKRLESLSMADYWAERNKEIKEGK